jgi:hypothetical protein
MDPDQDTIKYCFDWGDGNSDWSDYINSGEEVSMDYSWSEKGTYEVKVKLKDEHGLESDWSDPLSVKIPRSKHLSIQILDRLFQKFFNLMNLLSSH